MSDNLSFALRVDVIEPIWLFIGVLACCSTGPIVESSSQIGFSSYQYNYAKYLRCI